MNHLPVAVELAAISDVGLVRKNNEDALWFGEFLRDDRCVRRVSPVEAGSIFAVADGVGGAAAGEVASRLVVESMAAEMRRLVAARDAGEEAIRAVAAAVNRDLRAAGDVDPARVGMATTYTAILFREGGPIWLNAGDSRLYAWRDGALSQINRDHTLREEMGDPSIPGNIITNCFGGGGDFYIDVGTLGPPTAELYLLCSDGFSDYADADSAAGVVRSLTDVLQGGDDSLPALGSAAQKLLDLALAGGGGDNVSLMIVRPVDA